MSHFNHMRAKATTLNDIFARCGSFLATYAASYNVNLALMITASHNKHDDNGLKVFITNTGQQLPFTWQKTLLEFVVQPTPHDKFKLKNLCHLFPWIQPSESFLHNKKHEAVIYIGHDTRESCQVLLKNLIDGIMSVFWVSCKIVNVGLVTTPQLFYISFYEKRKSFYLQWLAEHFQHYSRQEILGHSKLIIDCANGPASVVLDKLQPIVPLTQKWILTNTSTSHLVANINEKCGSHWVENNRCFPRSSEIFRKMEKCRFASLDGDADRCIYYYYCDDEIGLLDGDAIICLVAATLKLLTKGRVKIGAIQTVFSNSESTLFLKNVLEFPVLTSYVGTQNMQELAHFVTSREWDIALYWEHNGHGSIIYNPRINTIIDQESMAFIKMFNPVASDGIANLCALEYILNHYISFLEWTNMYKPYPVSWKSLKVPRGVFKCSSFQYTCISPSHFQKTLNTISENYKARVIVRPSCTESHDNGGETLRVFVESLTHEKSCLVMEKIEKEILKITKDRKKWYKSCL